MKMATATVEPPRMGTRLLALPPAHGMRLFETENGPRILLLDDNARGYPWFALLVPVQVNGPDVSVAVDDAQACDAEALFKVSSRFEIADRRDAYVLDVTWTDPMKQHDVLVLLLCFGLGLNSGGVEFGRGPQELLNGNRKIPIPNRWDDALWGQVSCAVLKVLRSSPRSELWRGLLRKAPPSRGNGPTTFALASCLYPCDILDHMPLRDAARRGPADASLLALGQMLDGEVKAVEPASVPTLLVMAGDQVYVDATAGLFDPKSLDDQYRVPYETLFASRGAQAVFARRGFEIRMVIDDHEIVDNWQPIDQPAGASGSVQKEISDNAGRCKQGIDAYWRYECGLSTPPAALAPLWTPFEHRGLSFFLGDTRTERESRTAASFRDKLIMSHRQSSALEGWMTAARCVNQYKFVVTPSILLPRRLAVCDEPDYAIQCDSWVGYPKSLYGLLAFICESQVQKLVFLSGDEHLSCVAEVELSTAGKPSVRILSVHSSPLYAPYPFANSRPEDFPAYDCFEFNAPGSGVRYRCTVRTRMGPPGDGFALLTPQRDGVTVDFHRPASTAGPCRFTWPC